MPTAQRAGNLPAIICILALAAAFALKAIAAWQEYPESTNDEVIYMDAAMQGARTGRLASPGLILPLAAKGVTGLDRGTYFNLPMTLWIKVPLLKIVGANLRGLRLVDLLITVLATVAFAGVASCLARGWRWILATAVFLLNPVILWAQPGRPDLLSLGFGLAALWVLCASTGVFEKPARRGTIWWAGMLLGVCAGCHLFAGVFWCVMVGTLLLAGERNIKSAVGGLLILGAGAGVVLAVNAAWLLHGGSEAMGEFRWLLDLKKSLHRDFLAALVLTFTVSFARCPLMLPVLALFPSALGTARARRLAAWMLPLAALLVWRCVAFEKYHIAYTVHFWAVFCCAFAITLEGLPNIGLPAARWLTQTMAGGAVLAAVFVAQGYALSYNKWMESLMVSHADQNRLVEAAITNAIPRDARVLATCDAYFLMQAPNLTAMAHHDQLGLDSFDYIVFRNPPVQGPISDQWFDCLTPEQYADFNKSFRLLTNVPDRRFEAGWYPGKYRPWAPGALIYCRVSAADAAAPPR
jgi:4-amino-4-deoxy-L-arabinose transferase-like glycosyltransferase